MKTFVMMTKLPNIGGRAGYITDNSQQEEIVATSESVDWKPYQEFERSNVKTFTKSNEGRELVIAIPNEWYEIPRPILESRVQHLAELALGKSTDMQWAVHWNDDRTNLHVHIIFSERTREDKGTWDRDIYLTADGKVARKAADRARDLNGNVLPPIHRKGEAKGCFSAKDKKYTSRGWLHDTKQLLKETMERDYGVKFDKEEPFHEYHEGKGSESVVIHEKNMAIRISNSLFDTLRKEYKLTTESLRKAMLDAIKRGKIMIPFRKDGKILKGELTVEQYQHALKTSQERLQELHEAQREVFRQAFAINDKRPPLPADFGAKQKALKDALERYEDAKSAYDVKAAAVNAAISKLHFWNGKQKKQLRAELEEQRLAFRGVADQLHDAANLPKPITEYTLDTFIAAAESAYRNAIIADNKALDGYKPADAIKASPEALKAAQDRFQWLCNNLPQDERKNAYFALTRAREALPERGEARKQAVNLLERDTRSHFAAEVREIERPREHRHHQNRGGYER